LERRLSVSGLERGQACHPERELWISPSVERDPKLALRMTGLLSMGKDLERLPLRWVRIVFPGGITKYLHAKGEPCPALPAIQMTSMMYHFEKLPQCFT